MDDALASGSSAESEITEKQVEAYLRHHPKFFVSKDRLLKSMRIPHVSGKAVSLLERQNDLLREEVALLDQRLSDLIGNARNNDKLFARLRNLVLHVMAATDVEELVGFLHSHLTQYFNVDDICLSLKDNLTSSKFIKAFNEEKILNNLTLKELSQPAKCICGELSMEAKEILFKDILTIESVAVASIHSTQWQGVLALGSQDTGYFRNSMDTLFLSYLAEVIGVRLGQLS